VLPGSQDAALFSTQPWPSELLSPPDLDLDIQLNTLTRRGEAVGPIATHLVRAAGTLSADPLSITLPGGRLTGALTVSAAAEQPDIVLNLAGQGLRTATLLHQIGLPAVLSTDADIQLRLRGRGDSPHAFAASVSGEAGFAAVGGEVETGIATGPLGPLLPQLGMTANQAAGRGPLRCLAVAARLNNGTADISAITLDSAVLFVEGTGSVALGPETLDLRLKPTLRLPPLTGIAIPARVTGPIAKPRVGWDGPAPQGKAMFSAVIGTATQLIAPDACDRALAAARFGRSGAQPPPSSNVLQRLPDALKSVLPDLGKALNRLP
jgi:uncharacterized protein involved in outer membrane biogenesis